VTSYGPKRSSQSPVARSHVVSVDPGGSPADSQGVPTALRPHLAAGLPFAPKHWQIHHRALIDSPAQDLIPEIWVGSAENCSRWTSVQQSRRKPMSQSTSPGGSFPTVEIGHPAGYNRSSRISSSISMLGRPSAGLRSASATSVNRSPVGTVAPRSATNLAIGEASAWPEFFSGWLRASIGTMEASADKAQRMCS